MKKVVRTFTFSQKFFEPNSLHSFIKIIHSVLPGNSKTTSHALTNDHTLHSGHALAYVTGCCWMMLRRSILASHRPKFGSFFLLSVTILSSLCNLPRELVLLYDLSPAAASSLSLKLTLKSDLRARSQPLSQLEIFLRGSLFAE